MLSRHKRLRASEVEEVLSLGRSVRGGHLSMKFLQKKELLRVSAVVSKSLARKATLRNKLRRAVYDSIPASASKRTGHAIFFVRAVPQGSLRAVFKEEVNALLSKI